jgi:hypothetical protein
MNALWNILCVNKDDALACETAMSRKSNAAFVDEPVMRQPKFGEPLN